jgi:hypothetical protein
MIKTGTRLQSQVCRTQVIVVKTSEHLQDLRAGGVPMVPFGTPTPTDATADPALMAGNVMGKRYVDGAGGEVLVTQAGDGTLSAGATVLDLKEAKPLPASD